MLLQDQLKNYRLILASQSPRRKELLAGMGLNFEVMLKDVDETFDEITGIPLAIASSGGIPNPS